MVGAQSMLGPSVPRVLPLCHPSKHLVTRMKVVSVCMKTGEGV